jgi:hypothetical protein
LACADAVEDFRVYWREVDAEVQEFKESDAGVWVALGWIFSVFLCMDENIHI